MTYPKMPLNTPDDVVRAKAVLDKIDLTKKMTWQIKNTVRSDGQNRKMWAMLRDISRQIIWYEQKLSDEDWKHVFSASVKAQRSVPAIDGGFVVLGVSTRGQSKEWFSDLFEVMNAFGAEHGVKFTTLDYWNFDND